MNENSIASVTSVGMKVVLNGGSKILDSATLPIQWFFDESTTAKKPKWILVVCQSEIDMKKSSYFSGTRHLFRVTDRIGFIQLFMSGWHRIAIVVTNGDKKMNAMIEPDRDIKSTYEKPFCWPTGEEPPSMAKSSDCVVAYSTEEFEVPNGLFAHRSNSLVAKILWKWINRWHETEPRDQCQYRARAILAFTAQPVLVGIAYILWYIFASIGTSVLILGRFLVLFFGYRPLPFSAGISPLWNYDNSIKDIEWDYRLYPNNSYRVWKRSGSIYTRKKDDVLMPIVPFNIVLGAFFGYSIFILCPLILEYKMIIGKFILWLIVILISRWFLKKAVDVFIKHRKIKMDEPETPPRSDPYIQWLSTEMTSTRAPVKVDLHHLPKPFRNRAVHKMRIAFWATKMRVCKPFAR